MQRNESKLARIRKTQEDIDERLKGEKLNHGLILRS